MLFQRHIYELEEPLVRVQQVDVHFTYPLDRSGRSISCVRKDDNVFLRRVYRTRRYMTQELDPNVESVRSRVDFDVATTHPGQLPPYDILTLDIPPENIVQRHTADDV